MALYAGQVAGGHRGASGKKPVVKFAVWLASSALMLVLASPSQAQTTVPAEATAQSVSFSIPAQPLADAIKAFIRTTGWQVGYPAALVGNLQSRPVSGRLAPQAALQAMLAGTGIAVRITGPQTVTLVDAKAASAAEGGDTTVLDTISVAGGNRGVSLGTSSLSDTGTTTISGGQIVARSAGNDANDILRNLPNVQYQNDIDDDAGVSDQDLINLRPREVSISGARVYENNFILEGMPINTVTGTADSDDDTDVEDSLTPADVNRVYGLHSQSIYVPTDFLESTTVIDSNASARYGNFQGGVVSYKMQEAAKDRWKGNASTDFSTSRWTGYHVGTENGLNPNGVVEPEYLKRRSSVSLSGPVTDNISILGQYSTQSAVTSKDKDYRYTEKRRVTEESKNDFYRGQVKADTDFGDFTLEGVYTHYDQIWENARWRNMQINQAARGLNSKLEHNYEFADFSLGGVTLSNVKLDSKLTYGQSSTINDVNGNVARAFTQSAVKSRAVYWNATSLSDWCRTDPTQTIATLCYDGANGDRELGQEQISWSQDVTGDIWQGSFRLGAEYTYTDAYRRRPEDVTYYTSYTTIAGITSFSEYTCNTADECNSEMFAKSKSIYKAFDIHAHLNQFDTYAELEQTWDWFNVRAGVRATYDDYMQNLNVAPRVVTNITPWEDFTISLGANRYHSAQSLAFAIRDGVPRPENFSRTATSTGVVSDFAAGRSTGYLLNSASDLKTPYTDELSLGISGIEPLFDGQWRLRFLDRRSKDQYASEKTGSNYVLTNDAHGAYQSVTAEYSKELDVTAVSGLDQLLLNASVTWSRREVSNTSYYEDSLEDEYIYYHGQSYTKSGFNVVTGNMDIPLRFQAGLSSSWFDDTLKLDVNANYNVGYTGAKYTDENIVIDGRSHEIYEDFDFDPLLTVDLSASYQIYKKGEAGLTLNVRVDNVFDETGNATASATRPWLVGRTVWVGAKATF
ncbi:TonB-dependent receptor [Rhizobium sp. RM]|uniref:TonB-dependent receptor n=1 Tax=Rhizobium sp. RM TaxID=2748079 RepID=UPI0015B4B2DF|nr:TonB-dependent receptor [Rhizobium sp. RM]NWJ24345.1 TonB-dependent receptor plug domain-containing protein [Rhizobium sp. RM]